MEGRCLNVSTTNGNKVDPERTKALAMVLVSAVLWSLGGVLVKLVNAHPFVIAGMRSLVAGCIILAYVRKPRFTWSMPQIGAAVCYSLTVILFVTANKLTTAANAIMIQYTAPIYVAILSMIFLRERIRWFDWAAIAVSIGGVVLFFVGNISPGNIIGNVMSIFSGMLMGATVVFLRMQKDGSPIESTLLGNFLTFFIALPFIVKSPPLDMQSVIGILFLGVFQLGLSYIIFSKAIKHVTALEGILIPIIEPILNPIWVMLVVGEKPTGFAVVGGMIVIGAVTVRTVYATLLEKRKNDKDLRRRFD
jgi:drug/metabolite transporter (DMT)-like permease